MRGTIWTVVAVGVGAVMTPLILDIEVADGSTGADIMELLSSVGLLVSLAFIMATFGLLLVFFGKDGF
jgi:hypothetical protein